MLKINHFLLAFGIVFQINTQEKITLHSSTPINSY